MDIFPTGLSKLSKPFRTEKNLENANCLEDTISSASETNDYAHIEVVVTLVVANFFVCVGHSSLSHRQIVTKIGGKTSYRPPGPS